MNRRLVVLVACCSAVLLASTTSSPGEPIRYDARLVGNCIKGKDAGERIRACSRIIAAAPGERILEKALLSRGKAYHERGLEAEALKDFDRLIAINPTIAGYYDNRLYVYKAMGQLENALADANTAVKLAPKHAFVYSSRGGILEELGRYREAIVDFSKAIAISPEYAYRYHHRGEAFFKAGNFNAAIEDFTKTFDMDRSWTVAVRDRGLAYKALGLLDKARADLEWFVHAEPNDEVARNALRELGTAPPSASAGPDQPPTGGQDSRTSSGTGFFISRQGHVLTNAHVVHGCMVLRVSQRGYRAASVRLVASDGRMDLAVLKTDMQPDAVASLRIGVRLGEHVAAFGYPLSGILSSSGNFTLGNITALAGLDDDVRHFQFSAPVQPGNSGGPLLDMDGNVVGVVVAKLNAIRLADITNDVAQNVNFAIKASMAATFLESQDIPFAMGTASASAKRDIADVAKAAKDISVYIECKG